LVWEKQRCQPQSAGLPFEVTEVFLVKDPLFREHLTGAGHPESPARYDAVDPELLTSWDKMIF
jgi:hypothetical protein